MQVEESTPGETNREEEVSISIFTVLGAGVRWWKLTSIPLAFAFIAGMTTLLQDRSWSSVATFQPQGSGSAPNSSGLASLAGQFGVSVPVDEPTRSPQFYEELLGSRRLLLRVVRDSSLTAGLDLGPSLTDVFEIELDSPIQREELTLRALRGRLTTSIQRNTGTVRMAIATPDPTLSQRIATLMLERVAEFNLQIRQSSAAEEARFIRERLVVVDSAVDSAETRLQRWLENNRQFESSPSLTFEHQRLQEELSQARAVRTQLVQGLEQANIGRVRDTPVITVVDPPMLAVFPDGRGVTRRVAFAGMAGFILAMGLGLGLEGWRRAEASDDRAYHRFREQIRRGRGRDPA